jgi:hypothetical protein
VSDEWALVKTGSEVSECHDRQTRRMGHTSFAGSRSRTSNISSRGRMLPLAEALHLRPRDATADGSGSRGIIDARKNWDPIQEAVEFLG